jgi:RimJ/RimL family protein N-acetyltransferase
VTSIEPLRSEHFVQVAQWLSDPAINRWLTSEWRGRAVDSAVLAMATRNRRNRLYLVRHEAAACGLVALSDLDVIDRCAMIWYVRGERHLGGKGAITNAVNQLCRLAFNDAGLASIYAWIIQANEASRRVLMRNGFREAGVLRDAAVLYGEQVARVYFDLLPGDLTPGLPAGA